MKAEIIIFYKYINKMKAVGFYTMLMVFLAVYLAALGGLKQIRDSIDKPYKEKTNGGIGAGRVMRFGK